jgi:hypothetical protein
MCCSRMQCPTVTNQSRKLNFRFVNFTSEISVVFVRKSNHMHVRLTTFLATNIFHDITTHASIFLFETLNTCDLL